MPPMSQARSTGSTHKRDREVLDAAIEIFWRKGYSAAYISDVADQLGMLKGSLYYYVDSKEDLLMRIIQAAHDDAVGILAEIEALEVSALHRLRIFVERYVLWSLENLESVGLYFREWHSLTGERRETVRQQRKAFERFVSDLIASAQREGDAPDDQDVHTLMFFLLSAMNSVWAWYRRDGPLTPQQVAGRYSTMVVATVTGTRHDDDSLPIAGSSAE